MAANFAFKSKFEVNCIEKDKIPGIQNPSYVLKTSS
jgi:hypothetical protein